MEIELKINSKDFKLNKSFKLKKSLSSEKINDLINFINNDHIKLEKDMQKIKDKKSSYELKEKDDILIKDSKEKIIKYDAEIMKSLCSF